MFVDIDVYVRRLQYLGADGQAECGMQMVADIGVAAMNAAQAIRSGRAPRTPSPRALIPTSESPALVKE